MPEVDVEASRTESAWDVVIGQPAAVAHLKAAVAAPVHAYLLHGPHGSGKRAAARAFAGELLARGASPEEAERHRRLAAAEQHPDLVVVERTGAAISMDDAREIIRKASLSPLEGKWKVLVLDEFHLVRPDSAAAMLKAIEEPPPGTYFVVLAEEVTPELVTIASRCMRIDLAPIAASAIAARLEVEGVAPDAAREAAEAAHGDLRRARLLATDQRLALRLKAWREVPSRLDGSGHQVTVLIDELRATIDDAMAPLVAQLAAEVDALNEQIERYGLRGSGARQLEERHKRERRRFRADELRMGLGELARVYRDELTVALHPDRLLESLAAVQWAAEGLIRNPNEESLLQALFVRLAPLN